MPRSYWSIYLKLVALAPVAGIACLWIYLEGTHVSLMGFLGASSHMLIAIALIGALSILASGITLWVTILLPFKSNVSRLIISAMRRRSLRWRHRRVPPSRRRPFYWLALTYALPCFAGVMLGWYGPGRASYWWLWIVGLPPSVVTWSLLLRCGLGRRVQPFYALATLFSIAVVTTASAFILFLSIRSEMPFVYYQPGHRGGHWAELIVYHGLLALLAAALSVGLTMIVAPADSERISRLKLWLAGALVVMTALLRSTPVYIVQVAFFLFASGGEHRVYASLTGKALEIPASACEDTSCATSRTIRITADLGNVVYGHYESRSPDGTVQLSTLQKLDMSHTTYTVLRTDTPVYSELHFL